MIPPVPLVKLPLPPEPMYRLGPHHHEHSSPNYLTPHKIYLLHLIRLYARQQIDPIIAPTVGSFLVDQLTVRSPFNTIFLLSVILSFLLP